MNPINSNVRLSGRQNIISLISIFLLAFLLRISLIFHLGTHNFPVEDDYWSFGYDTGRIAASLARGNGYSSPFRHASGSTSWVAPIYPSILALIFKIFGIYSQSSAIAILLLQCIISSITCITIYYISRKVLRDEKLAVLTAALFAIYPPSIWHAINTIWDTTLFSFSNTVLFLALISIASNFNLRNTILVGILMGIVPLINPVILSFYPLALVWLFMQLKSKGKPVTKAMIFISAITLLTVSIWLVRNFIVFHRFVFIKSNFGVELRIGNNPLATGSLRQSDGAFLHPALLDKEFMLYKQMGEVNYSRHCFYTAMRFIRENPRDFLLLSLKRTYYFWFGDQNGWQGNIKGAYMTGMMKRLCYILPLPFFIGGLILAWARAFNISLFLYLFLSFPIVYYITHATNKYRYPIEPLLLVIAAYGLYNSVMYVIPALKTRTLG